MKRIPTAIKSNATKREIPLATSNFPGASDFDIFHNGVGRRMALSLVH
jgi:hypothetical protein